MKREREGSVDQLRGQSPSAAKRQNTGERAAGTPAPMSASFAPSGPWGPGSDMLPPSTPGFPNPASQSQAQTPNPQMQMQNQMSGAGHGQMARPGSSMGLDMGMGMGGMQTAGNAGMGSDSMMPPSTPSMSPGAAMGMAANMNNLSPEAQARLRQQIQMRQQQAMLQQQQQQSMQPQQHLPGQPGQQNANPSMSPPQSQLLPTAQQQQQMLLNSGQMSPPGSSGGASMPGNMGGMGMGMNAGGMDASSMGQNQNPNMGAQGGMNMGMGMNMGGGMPGAGGMNNMGLPSNQGGNMGQMTQQQVQMLTTTAMSIVQNPGHQIMQQMNNAVPNFTSLPIQEQVKRIQMHLARQVRVSHFFLLIDLILTAGIPASLTTAAPTTTATDASR